MQAQRGNAYFTELAERVEYGSYVHAHIHAMMYAMERERWGEAEGVMRTIDW